MSKADDSKALSEAHNKGQSDAKEGKNDPPGCAFEDIGKFGHYEEREAYRSGQEAHKNSKK